MIRRGAAWIKDPALAGAGFQYLTFVTRKAAQAWLDQNGKSDYRIERAWVRVGGL